jgi:hypothetical protein
MGWDCKRVLPGLRRLMKRDEGIFVGSVINFKKERQFNKSKIRGLKKAFIINQLCIFGMSINPKSLG